MPATLPDCAIAALQPSISIILDRLDALDTLVACTRYCVDAVPALAQRSITIVKDSWSCTTDEILRAKPTLVLASVPYRMESLAALLKSGCPVVTLAPHTLADIYADIRLIGSIVHRVDAAESLVAEMQQEIASDTRPLFRERHRDLSSIAKNGASRSSTRSPGLRSWSRPPADNSLASPQSRPLRKRSPRPIPT